MDTKKVYGKIKKLSENNKFSGCVLLREKDDDIFSFCCGYASKEYDIKNTFDTRFNIASVGKPITGVAITKLIQDGIIDPSKEISTYLNLKNSIFSKVSIEQLLTHTSGLGDYFQQAYNSPYTQSYEDFKDFSAIVEGANLSFVPGEKWDYSNLGYLVLGLLFENLTGMDYYTFINKNIFIPANMINSGFWLYNEPIKNRASGYYYDEEKGIWRNRVVNPVLRGTSAGGWFSTVDDLSKFMNALLQNKLLDSKFTKKVITPKPEINSPGYGYGFYISDKKISHGGNGTGISSQLTHYISSGYTLSVLCNYSSGANDVERIIDEELL